LKVKKVLIITAHRKDRAPNQRFRFEQYLDYLKDHGFDCEVSNLINEQDDRIFYKPGHLFNKGLIVLKAALKRTMDVINRNKFDIIFICREGFLTGTTFFESMLRRSKAKIVYDFDDAIWHFDVSEANKNMGWLKNPGKTAKLISLADIVFAGNQYLADYAKRHNDSVVIIPTTIDTEEYKPVNHSGNEKVCIGWSGSITTIRHFEVAVPVFKKLKAKFGDKIFFKVIGDGSYRNEELGIVGDPWKKETELAELAKIDIGIMPLPNDEWAKGKCGLKGLQYMALNIATVMSPVGVNTEIIQDGENGFLADTEEEWVDKLSILVEDAVLRRKVADNGRRTVEEKFSVKSQQARYLHYFNELTKN
jgi:glycosyltransferase involved in cell wall biosynthesis